MVDIIIEIKTPTPSFACNKPDVSILVSCCAIHIQKCEVTFGRPCNRNKNIIVAENNKL